MVGMPNTAETAMPRFINSRLFSDGVPIGESFLMLSLLHCKYSMPEIIACC